MSPLPAFLFQVTNKSKKKEKTSCLTYLKHNSMNTTTTEIWVTVKDYPMYEVSNLGNVRSWHARGNKELADEPTILSTYSDEQGYKRITLAVSEAPGKRYSAYVHRLIAEAFVGPVEGMKVRHLNDIKSDNRLENLALGTHEDNMADMKANGNHTWNRKLTFEQAEEIRQRFADGETIKAIHQDFPDVTYVAMRAVANGRRYQTEERHYGPTGDAA